MNTLIILLGPTGVGKTGLSLDIAELTGSPIISSDSRQLYRDLPIGTAAPTEKETSRVKHYMTGILNLADYYSAAQFETDVMELLEKLFKKHSSVIMCGGSMMYIDAVCNGIDEIPSVSAEVREEVWKEYAEKGLEPLLDELASRDPLHYDRIDRQNGKRVVHAIEICRQTGRPYSSFRTGKPKPRPFNTVKIGLRMDRKELYERINSRVDAMMKDGLLDEALKVYPFRHYNSLNTVGYKELFEYFDSGDRGDLASTVEQIKRNTRVYSRKQMTWFRRDGTICWFHPSDIDGIMTHLNRCLDIKAATVENKE